MVTLETSITFAWSVRWLFTMVVLTATCSGVGLKSGAVNKARPACWSSTVPTSEAPPGVPFTDQSDEVSISPTGSQEALSEVSSPSSTRAQLFTTRVAAF